MTESDNNKLQQWQDALGDDVLVVWQALDVYETPSPLRSISVRKPWIAFGKLAAVLACVGLVSLLQWQSLQQSKALREENIQLRLLSRDALVQLAVLSQIQNLPREATLSFVPQLMHVFTTSEDPNVQLSALELLVRLQIINSTEDLPTLASERRQAQFINATYKQLYGE